MNSSVPNNNNHINSNTNNNYQEQPYNSLKSSFTSLSSNIKDKTKDRTKDTKETSLFEQSNDPRDENDFNLRDSKSILTKPINLLRTSQNLKDKVNKITPTSILKIY